VRTYQRLKVLSDTMHSAAKMDFLTGAVTRRQLEKALTQEWLRAQRSASPLTLLLADIEGFSAYNAEFGEESGDHCLKSVAGALRAAARRPVDILGRYAGGKFALLLPDTDARGAGIVARRAIEAVDELQILNTTAAGRDRVRLSVGIGCRDSSRSGTWNAADASVPNELIVAAEQALKSASSAGGHQAKVHNIDEQAKSQ
jgi:diguanylate cyclase (GGDEF)-like protein